MSSEGGECPSAGFTLTRERRDARLLLAHPDEADRRERAAQEPERADDEVDGVTEEGRAVALDGVPDELEDPPHDEQPQRPAPVPEEERQAQDNHRDADGMRQLVQRVLVLRLVVFDERTRHGTHSVRGRWTTDDGRSLEGSGHRPPPTRRGKAPSCRRRPCPPRWPRRR